MNIKYHPRYKKSKIKYTVIHHSGGFRNNPLISTQGLTVKDIDNAHADRWYRYRNIWNAYKSSLGYYVGYSFVIEKSGKTTQTRASGAGEVRSTPIINNGSIILNAGSFINN